MRRLPSLHFLSPEFLVSLRRLGVVLGAVGLAQATALACSDDDGDGGSFGRPTLEFLEAQNTAGESFSYDENGTEIAVVCDSRITFLLGPSSDADGLLDSWVMRPAGACGGQLQCGFIRLSLLDADGKPLLVTEQASLYPVISLAMVDLPQVESVHAVLIDGNTGDEYEYASAPVTSNWNIVMTAADCPDGFGGAGGAGGGGGAGGAGGASN